MANDNAMHWFIMHRIRRFSTIGWDKRQIFGCDTIGFIIRNRGDCKINGELHIKKYVKNLHDPLLDQIFQKRLLFVP